MKGSLFTSIMKYEENGESVFIDLLNIKVGTDNELPEGKIVGQTIAELLNKDTSTIKTLRGEERLFNSAVEYAASLNPEEGITIIEVFNKEFILIAEIVPDENIFSTMHCGRSSDFIRNPKGFRKFSEIHKSIKSMLCEVFIHCSDKDWKTLHRYLGAPNRHLE